MASVGVPARAVNRQSSPLILGRAKELTELSMDLSSRERWPELGTAQIG